MSPEKLKKGHKFEDYLQEVSSLGTDPRIQHAAQVAFTYHIKQIRQDGSPYFTHCLAAAKILHDELGIDDTDLIVATLLHDSVEDTEMTIEVIHQLFGSEVASLVDGVTEIKSRVDSVPNFSLSNSNRIKSTDHASHTKVVHSTYLNPKVGLIKVSDRLHNLRTLGYVSPDKQKTKAQETRAVYLRLAESLGLWQVKREMEDVCFKILDPNRYQYIDDLINRDPRSSHDFIAHVKSFLSTVIGGADIQVVTNSHFAINEKLGKMSTGDNGSPLAIASVKDLVSFRIICPDESTCRQVKTFLEDFQTEQYRILHNLTQFKTGDYADPNGYQAINMFLNMGSEISPILSELAIVSQEQEDFNQLGIAALVRRGQSLNKYNLKYVFTPDGSLRFLTAQSTGYDFAATLGNLILVRGTSMSVDGEEKLMSEIIPNGSTVLINTDGERQDFTPTTLLFCNMPSTRIAVQTAINRQEITYIASEGHDIIRELLSSRGLVELEDLPPVLLNEFLISVGGCTDIQELYLLVGSHSKGVSEVVHCLDHLGITKELLGYSTIILNCEDHSGLLGKITRIITHHHLNIEKISQSKDGNQVSIRLVVSRSDNTTDTLDHETLIGEIQGIRFRGGNFTFNDVTVF